MIDKSNKKFWDKFAKLHVPLHRKQGAIKRALDLTIKRQVKS